MIIGGVFGADPARARLTSFACLVLALIGWTGLAGLCRELLARNPPAAGFDLELLLEAARRVAAGGSPYDATAVQSGVTARDLFYSYPPLVAQVLAPVSGLPTWLVLAGWWIGAIAGLALVAVAMARTPATGFTAGAMGALLVAVAAAPLCLPFAVGLLFGNIDAWFPLLIGAVAVAVACRDGSPPGRAVVLAGSALAVASAVKLHPATLLLWLAVRAVRRADPGRNALLGVLGAAVAVSGALFVLSLIAGGLRPWLDYPDYLRLGSNASLASRVNIGPASQLAVLFGNDGLARPLAYVFAGLAVVATVAVARLVRDPLESFGWAVVSSLVVLPVTWYHYPVALLPVALAAWVWTRGTAAGPRVTIVLAAAYVVADLAIVLPVALWIAVALVMLAVRWARDPGAGVLPARPVFQVSSS